MTEAAQVQKMLNEQNVWIGQLKSKIMRLELELVGYRTRNKQLEAALREIVGALDDPKGGQHVYDMRNASYIARKALEGTPDMSVYKEGYRAVEEAMGHPSPEFWVEKRE